MPISMGIISEACGIVHLVTATVNRRMDYLRQAGSEMFILTCVGCRTKRSFHESDLTLYSVSTLGYIKGNVARGEYSARRDLVSIWRKRDG
jgi:hypothetical protein